MQLSSGGPSSLPVVSLDWTDGPHPRIPMQGETKQCTLDVVCGVCWFGDWFLLSTFYSLFPYNYRLGCLSGIASKIYINIFITYRYATLSSTYFTQLADNLIIVNFMTTCKNHDEKVMGSIHHQLMLII